MLTATRFEIEHVVPRAAGGETAAGNLCLACPACNRFKSDSTSATDPVTAAVVPLFHPHRDAWPDHVAWTGDGLEVVGRTAVGRATVAAFRMNRQALVRVRRPWVRDGRTPAGPSHPRGGMAGWASGEGPCEWCPSASGARR